MVQKTVAFEIQMTHQFDVQPFSMDKIDYCSLWSSHHIHLPFPLHPRSHSPPPPPHPLPFILIQASTTAFHPWTNHHSFTDSMLHMLRVEKQKKSSQRRTKWCNRKVVGRQALVKRGPVKNKRAHRILSTNGAMASGLLWLEGERVTEQKIKLVDTGVKPDAMWMWILRMMMMVNIL